ncbi:MAG: hypothetical protein WCV59_05130 [Parcubacteria group bacterium]|jgi:hypothetical protein
MKHIILPGLTTTPKSDWREKIREIDRCSIEEIALFPTFLELPGRKELYSLLENTKLKRIPHVHLRSDMEAWELELFNNKYKTEVFNIHPEPTELGFLENLKKTDNVYVENTNKITDFYFEVADMCGGVCLDISHWEDYGIPEGYDDFSQKIEKYKIGCSHISAIKKDFKTWEHYTTKEKLNLYSDHYMDDLSELDYVKKYVQYLPEYVSIELENSFEEQLKVKEYLEKIING